MSERYLLSLIATLVVFVASVESVTRAQTTTSPIMLDLVLPNGAVIEEPVSLTIHPFCIRPIDVDVVASDPTPLVENLTRVLLNGCGGDTSTFDIRFTGDGIAYNFDLQFVDSEFGGVIDAIPVTIRAPNPTCDLNGDGSCDIHDIDALIMAIAAGSNDPIFDLNGDGLVDLTDRDEWLAGAGAQNLPSGSPYLVADFDLNSVVDAEDFIDWNANKFSNTGKWSLADANGDGVTDAADFIEWNRNKFMSADGLAVVPEPGAGVFLIASLISLAVVRRRRRRLI